MREYYASHPEAKLKASVRKKVYTALRNGKLVKQPCHCGNVKVEAHHEDYSKPLEVKWLCKQHHLIDDKL